MKKCPKVLVVMERYMRWIQHSSAIYWHKKILNEARLAKLSEVKQIHILSHIWLLPTGWKVGIHDCVFFSGTQISMRRSKWRSQHEWEMITTSSSPSTISAARRKWRWTHQLKHLLVTPGYHCCGMVAWLQASSTFRFPWRSHHQVTQCYIPMSSCLGWNGSTIIKVSSV